MDYSTRLYRLRQSLSARRLDALLVSQPENRLYLSGYSAPDHGIAETSGLLLIPRSGKPYLLTDFRFKEQAETETKNFEVLLYSKGLIALLKKILPDLGIKKLGFESHYTLHSTAQKLKALGRTIDSEMVPVSGLIERMRLIKSEAEIERIRQAVSLNEQVFQDVYRNLDSFETEVDVALAIGSRMRQLGAERESFETIVASGTQGSLPHAVPGLRKLVPDSPLVIDMGLVLAGYCSDMTRSFCYGKSNGKYLEVHRLVRRAQLAGVAAVRAGVSGREVDKAARKVIADGGYGKYFGHALGHGVGLAVHEEPRVSPKSRKKLKPGMVITIEPGIYLPGWGGIRLENMVVVREDGCEELNTDTTCLDI